MNLDGYVDVPERLRRMFETFPDLRLQESPPEIVQIGERVYISVTVTAWRTPDDPLPAIATCWEPWPGRTNYTRDSEQMNASTSALGRVANLLMPIGKTLASREEVRNRQPDERPAQNVEPDAPPFPDDPERTDFSPVAKKAAARAALGSAVGPDAPASDKQWNAIRTLCQKAGQDVPTESLTRRAASELIQYLQDVLPR